MNTPRNNPNGIKGSTRNSQISSMVFAILEALKNKPENKEKDSFQILKEFLDNYRIDSDGGLLQEISKNGTVTFDMVKDDGFTIEQIIGEDKNSSASILHNVLNSSSVGELGKDIEKVVISKLVENIKAKVPSNLHFNLDKELNNPHTLNELKTQIWNFLEYGDGGKNIGDDVIKEIKDIRIENKDIIDGLVKNGKIGVNDVDGNFKNWNAGISKKFDKLVTQEYLSGMKSSLEFLEKNFGLLKNTFNDFVPNLGWISKKYPGNQDDIDAETKEEMDKAQENGEIQKFNKIDFQAYIQSLGKNNKRLADILKKLFENDFDFGKLNKEEQNDFLKESISARLDELKNNNVSNLIGADKSVFEDFVKNLFDLNQNEIVIGTAQGDIRLGVNKKIREGKNINWMDMSDINEAKIPLEFDIKVLDQDNDLLKNAAIRKVFANEISEDGKSISLDSDNIGKLFLLYVLAQNSFDKRVMNEDRLKELDKIFGNDKDDKDKKEGKEDKDSKESDKDDEAKEGKESWTGIEAKEKSKEQKFLETWDTIKGYQFPNSKGEFFEGKEIGKGFEVGSRLWIKTGFDTELPPKDVGGDQWIQLKIVDITNTNFVLELEGGELSAGNLEGKKITYYKYKKEEDTDKRTLDDLINAFNGDIYKLPNPQNWEKSFGAFSEGNFGMNGSGIFREVKREKGKFISNLFKDEKGKEEEITHRGMDSREYDDKGKEEIIPIYYKVSHNSDNTFTVELENYKRKMDYNNFMIFVSSKNLKPSTKKNAEDKIKSHDREARDKHKGRKEWKFFGIKQIIEVFKGVGKKVEDALKNYSKERQDLFNEFLVSDVGIYKKMAGLMSIIPGAGDAFQSIELEYWNERDNKIWKKTEKWLKIFEADPDFGASLGQTNFLRPYLGSLDLKSMIIEGKLPKDRYIASAALLAFIKKGKSPYRGIDNLRLKGARVKLLLGEEHQKRFLSHQQELIREIESKKGIYGPGYDGPMLNDLVKAEMTYLINNIGGRATGQRFGQILGEKGGDDNPKRMRSDAFAGKLDEYYGGRVSQSKIEEEYKNAEKFTNFTFCYNEFKRFSESGRSTQALPFLKRMATLAKSPQQKSILKMCIIGGMLSGFFLYFAERNTKGRLESICRSMGFSPGLRITRYEQKEKIAYMLDYISKGKFSKDTKYNSNNFGINADKIDFKNFYSGEKGGLGFEKWWNANGTSVETFLRKLPIMEDHDGKKISEDPIMSELKGLSIENQVEGTDNDVNTNSKVITDSPLTQTKGFVQMKMMKYRDGMFEGNVDEVQAAEDFWASVSNKIPQKIDSQKELIDITKIYLNWFSDTFDASNKEEFVKTLATVKKYRNDLDKKGGVIKKQFGSVEGIINNSDIKNLLWYMVNGKVLRKRSAPPQEFMKAMTTFEQIFWNNINKIDDSFISQTFGKENLQYFNDENSYELVPWNVFERITKVGTSQLTEDEKKFKNKYNELVSKGVIINENMKRIYDDLNRKMSCPPLGGKAKEDEKKLFD